MSIPPCMRTQRRGRQAGHLPRSHTTPDHLPQSHMIRDQQHNPPEGYPRLRLTPNKRNHLQKKKRPQYVIFTALLFLM